MSAPPDTSYVRTPPIKSLIFKEFKSRPSLILLASNFALVAGHPCGVPPRLRRGSPSGNKCPPEGGELAPPARGACRSPHPPFGRAVAPLWGLRPPRPAGAAPPFGVSNGQGRSPRRPKAGGHQKEKNINLVMAGAGGYVGEGWAAGGQSLWSSSWAGAACPSACPAGLSTGRAKRASRCPKGIVHISTGRGL